jgi:hypothetical protein
MCHIKSSFRKFYGRHNNIVYDYTLSLTHILYNLFHILLLDSRFILTLTMGNSVHLISTKGVLWV